MLERRHNHTIPLGVSEAERDEAAIQNALEYRFTSCWENHNQSVRDWWCPQNEHNLSIVKVRGALIYLVSFTYQSVAYRYVDPLYEAMLLANEY